MKNRKYLKRLAEQHFFFGKKLTVEESFLLKNSPYSKLVKENRRTVDNVIENVMKGENYKQEEDEIETPKKLKKLRGIHVGLDRQAIKDLIDDVELEFDLDLTNPSPFKYHKVDPIKLKDFIRKTANMDVNDVPTLDHINSIINREDLNSSLDVLYRLYTAAGV
jgi:hypothetical protein